MTANAKHGTAAERPLTLGWVSRCAPSEILHGNGNAQTAARMNHTVRSEGSQTSRSIYDLDPLSVLLHSGPKQVHHGRWERRGLRLQGGGRKAGSGPSSGVWTHRQSPCGYSRRCLTRIIQYKGSRWLNMEDAHVRRQPGPGQVLTPLSAAPATIHGCREKTKASRAS